MSLKAFLQDRNTANIMERVVDHVVKCLETLVEFERGFVYRFILDYG